MPRICFLRAIHKFWKSCPRDFGIQKEMLGWELSDRPDLLLDSEDDEIDNEMGHVDH